MGLPSARLSAFCGTAEADHSRGGGFGGRRAGLRRRARNCMLGPLPRLAVALDAATKETYDVEVLDINLLGELVYPLAEILTDRKVLFCFLPAIPAKRYRANMPIGRASASPSSSKANKRGIGLGLGFAYSSPSRPSRVKRTIRTALRRLRRNASSRAHGRFVKNSALARRALR